MPRLNLVVHDMDGGAYLLTEIDGTRLEGIYSGNRLKRHWAREIDVDKKAGSELESKSELDVDETEEDKDSAESAWSPSSTLGLHLLQPASLCPTSSF